MSDTASSPIHVSFSDEKKEELLVQQPSASSVVWDDSQGQHNAEESPLQVYEIPGSPPQADELNEQPQQSAAKKQSITTNALDMESLPLHLQQFLLAVKQYFNQSINLLPKHWSSDLHCLKDVVLQQVLSTSLSGFHI